MLDNINSAIADKLLRMQLADIRKSKHLSQKQVSELSGLSESCISNIESGGQSSPTLRSLMRYLDTLGIELYIRHQNNDVE